MNAPPKTDETISVLILEDNDLDLELTEVRLAQLEYPHQVWTAASKAEFTELFVARHYDLILADYSLPDFDGLSALAIVREHDKDVPFIFVSGALGEEIAVETLHRGATDYVLKQRLDRMVPAISRALKEYFERRSRIHAESMLKQNELRFQQMTNVLSALLWTTDDAGRTTYFNHAWETYLGEKLPEVWCDHSVVYVDDLPIVTRQWRDALTRGTAFECECRICRFDDAYRWHLVRIVPIDPESREAGWIGTGTDIEAQKRREDLLRTSEKLVVIGRMAGAIAHEINNPLESLTNLLYLMGDSDVREEPGKTYMKQANDQLERIASITKQTLAFYRDKASLGDIECNTLIDETVALFRGKLARKKIEVNIEVTPRCHLQALTGEIRQILINLVSNAIDAMEPGGTLRLAAHECGGADDPQVCFEVEDTGHGIPPDVREHLFEPFFSTKGSLGTGLGLWVSQGIVKRHGGVIQLESVPGSTRFCILLPRDYRGTE